MSIAKLWVKKIREGKKTIEDVPSKLKDDVQAILDEHQ